MEGAPLWARFCPGSQGSTSPAEVPSDALITHMELLDGLVALRSVGGPRRVGCAGSGARTYRLQIGYDDGRVATVVGHTDPHCAGYIPGAGTLVDGPNGLGVYGLLMTAFGRQHADGFEDAAGDQALACPTDPRQPDSVDRDGASASMDTGYVLGERAPMVMPLPAVRGIVCTWPFGAESKAARVRDLSPEDAERVRIGLHAITSGMVDCGGSPEPTHTAVVEDRTGTRRAVTVVDSECETVIRSDEGYGLGLAWLER